MLKIPTYYSPGVFIKTILELDNIKIPTINQKYGFSPKSRKLYLNHDYRKFKELLHYSTTSGLLDPPYEIVIEIKTYKDIDAAIKVILDSLEGVVIENDKFINKLTIFKIPIKKGSLESLRILGRTI